MDLLDQKELTKLFKEELWNNETAKNYYFLSATTGLSLEELDNLNWENIDLTEKAITVKDIRKKIRMVPINPVALKVLEGMDSGNGPIFNDTEEYEDDFDSALINSTIEIGERIITHESLRESFLELLRSQGMDEEKIARVYG